MRRRLSSIQNERGNVAVFGLVLLGIVGFIAAGIFARQQENDDLQRRAQLILSGENLKRQLGRWLYDQSGWEKTSEGNPCLRSGSECLAGQSGALVLKDAAGSVLVDNSQSEGFNRDGMKCTSVDGAFSNAGNDKCPFKYELSWQAVACRGLPLKCRIQVVGTFRYSPSPRNLSRFPLNPQRFSLNFQRGFEADSLRSACSSSSGTFNERTGLCESAVVTCPPNSTLVTVKNDEVPTCVTTHKEQTCPGGQWAVGVKADGSLSCLPAEDIRPTCTYSRTESMSACECVGTSCTKKVRLIWTYANGTECNSAQTVEVCGG